MAAIGDHEMRIGGGIEQPDRSAISDFQSRRKLAQIYGQLGNRSAADAPFEEKKKADRRDLQRQQDEHKPCRSKPEAQRTAFHQFLTFKQ